MAIKHSRLETHFHLQPMDIFNTDKIQGIMNGKHRIFKVSSLFEEWEVKSILYHIDRWKSRIMAQEIFFIEVVFLGQSAVSQVEENKVRGEDLMH